MYYKDENGIFDFIVEVDDNRNPIILQITDTQIIDSTQVRTDTRLSAEEKVKYLPQNRERLCYSHIRRIVEAVKPDLIIFTGDLVYGEFDDSGSIFIDFVEFMESLNIPWAPVFGNHDAESVKGVDWQCEQFASAPNCLFKQRNLMGNGNYTVAIKHRGKFTRVFVMLDSNCSNKNPISADNGHTRRKVGFDESQMDWYTATVKNIKNNCPEIKVSFAFHIQLSVFSKAMSKYGFDNTSTVSPSIIVDSFEYRNRDFGYIGAKLKNEWDTDMRVWNSIKALGCDSVFVGHEHCNSASIVYDGIRLQYGQKSSEYDRINYLHKDGSICGKYMSDEQPLVGGTVIPLSKNGEIVQSYIYISSVLKQDDMMKLKEMNL